MANICDNTFYMTADSKEVLKETVAFLEGELRADVDFDLEDHFIDAYFDSKWTFPKEIMDKLYESLDKEEPFEMRCLSIEYGCDYHELWRADENKPWYSV